MPTCSRLNGAQNTKAPRALTSICGTSMGSPPHPGPFKEAVVAVAAGDMDTGAGTCAWCVCVCVFVCEVVVVVVGGDPVDHAQSSATVLFHPPAYFLLPSSPPQAIWLLTLLAGYASQRLTCALGYPDDCISRVRAHALSFKRWLIHPLCTTFPFCLVLFHRLSLH